MDKEQFYQFIKRIPKAELHLHSEALISRKVAGDILSRYDQKYKDEDILNQLFSYNDLKGFIRVFLLLQTAYKKISDFKKLFSNILPYLKRNGIVYAELFFSPSIFVKNGLEFDDIIKIFIDEIDSIKEKEKDKINLKIIIDVSRTFGVENAMKNLEATISCRCSDIIGIGLGGDEKKGPAKDYFPVFKAAQKNGFHCVAHAGEDVGPESIWDAIRLLKAERIGHGTSAVNDNELIDYLIEKQLPLEICPTSNVFTKKYVKNIALHPIKDFYQKGILVTLNTDDPAFFNVELLDEYWNLYSKLKFTLDEIKQVIINGFKASFIPEKEKQKYIKTVHAAWEKNIALHK